MKFALVLALALFGLASCSSTSSPEDKPDGGTSTTGTFTDVATSGAVFDTATPVTPDAGAGSSADRCIAGTSACGTSNWCCETWKTCLENPNDKYFCGTEYCCVGCGGAPSCGAGCCNTGQACVVNNGNMPGCTTANCCETIPPADVCPVEVAAECQDGTTCRRNKSARACPGSDFACYVQTGTIGCPGETMCPNGVEFCPAGQGCGSHPVGSGTVCPVTSSSGNYCCKNADPCNAVGMWNLTGPSFAGCSGAQGSCQPGTSYSFWATISADLAFNGGTWDESDRTFTFTPSTCNLHFVQKGSLCGDLPGDFDLSTGKGTSLFACWNNGTSQCSCTVQRPADSCSATKF